MQEMKIGLVTCKANTWLPLYYLSSPSCFILVNRILMDTGQRGTYYCLKPLPSDMVEVGMTDFKNKNLHAGKSALYQHNYFIIE